MAVTSFIRPERGPSSQVGTGNAVRWSRLPAHLRRGLSRKHAESAGISIEWHPRGALRTDVYVYRPEQMQTFWDECDRAGILPGEIKGFGFALHRLAFDGGSHEDFHLVKSVRQAAAAAETVRRALIEEKQL